MKPIIIYPCDFSSINKIDLDYEFERNVAKECGLLTYFFNYDEFVSLGKSLKLNFYASNIKLKAIYRGWMLNSKDYKRFYNELLEKYNIELFTTPSEYENTHYFVNSYERISKYTPKTIWFEEGKEIDWNIVRESFDKFIVKDFVKSVKGFNFPEFLDSSLSDEELNSYIFKFKEIRGDLYSGGIVLKEFIDLNKIGNHTHEFRAFYINGKFSFMYANSNNEKDFIPNYKALEKQFSLIDSPFYTIDFALTNKGDYIVIEIGDGQVSGIPSVKEAKELYNFIKSLDI